MGFFSYDCKACGNPLLSCYATNGDNDWMMEGVAVMADGRVIMGMYSGYGVLGSEELRNDEKRHYDVYHHACYELAGSPEKYSGVPSEWSDDQGYFFDQRDYDIKRPIKKPLKRDPYVIRDMDGKLVEEMNEVFEFHSRIRADNFMYKYNINDHEFEVVRRSWT